MSDSPRDLQASPARMYDYFLGGHHNFPVDRAAAEGVIAAFPDMPIVAQANRAFLRRAVSYLLEQGIDQFLDLGSGIPTVGNVHEVAHRARPDARVVYVDIDPVAVSHGRSLLAENRHATVLEADVRNPDALLSDATIRSLLDFGRPLGVLLVAVLHFMPDEATARHVLQTLLEHVAPGSFVVFSHALSDTVGGRLTADRLHEAEQVWQRTSAVFAARTRGQIAGLLEGLELVEPGLVLAPLWRPEGPDDVLLEEPGRSQMLVAVGKKPVPA